MSRLFWRVIPIFILIYTMKGTAGEYTKYFAMAKETSHYAMTYLSLSQFVPALQTYYAEHTRLPPDLGGFLRANFSAKGHDPGLDYWDKPFTLTEKSNEFTLTSCGIDRTCSTEDDLFQSAPKQASSSVQSPNLR